jgi:hypothetical protein
MPGSFVDSTYWQGLTLPVQTSLVMTVEELAYTYFPRLVDV